MISMITPLAAGNAIQLLLRPPASADRWRLLRHEVDEFTGPDDENAVLVFDGELKTIVDDIRLENGAQYFYKPYYLLGDRWDEGDSRAASPKATYEDRSVDALSIVRERMEAGLRVEVDRGTLRHDKGLIPVLTAPPQYDETSWPVVTVGLVNERDEIRALGEMVEVDEGIAHELEENEGWIASTQLSIVGWSLNPDERIELRKALRRIIVANLPIFEANGMQRIGLSQQDMHDFESYSAPVYQALCTLTCLSPIVVGHRVDGIADIKTVVTSSI